MAYSFIGHVEGSGQSTFTTGNLDTSGADLIVIIFSHLAANGDTAISDNQGNSYTARTQYDSGANAERLYYKQAPTTSTTHTFTSTLSLQYGSMVVLAFSGSATTPYNTENGATTTGTTLQPGSITPSEDNCVVVAGLSAGATGTYAIDSGFSTVYQVNYSGGVNYGVAAAYKIQTTAAAVNPTFSGFGFSTDAATQASFKAVAASSGDTQEWMSRSVPKVRQQQQWTSYSN